MSEPKAWTQAPPSLIAEAKEQVAINEATDRALAEDGLTPLTLAAREVAIQQTIDISARLAEWHTQSTEAQ